VETAAESLRDLRVAEVTKMDMKVEKGKVAAFRTRRSPVQPWERARS
jgi:flavin-binding protein dodecin